MDEFDNFPLHAVIFDKSLSDDATALKLKELLEQPGAHVNETAGRGNMTPLIIASMRDKVHVVQLLLCHEANLDMADTTGCTALHWAAVDGRTEVAKELLAHAANPHIVKHDGDTALHRAAYNGHVDVIKLLATAMKDVNVKNKQGNTPLDEAVERNEAEAFKELIKLGADASHEVLLSSINMNDADTLKILVSNYNFDINVADKDGNTALHHAVNSDNASEETAFATVKLLKEAGANFDLKNKEKITGRGLGGIKNKRKIVDYLTRNCVKQLENLVTENNKNGVRELLKEVEISKLEIDAINAVLPKIEDWPQITSDGLHEKVKETLEVLDVERLNVIFNNIDTEVQKELFLVQKVQHNKIDGKTCIQRMGEKGDKFGKVKEDYLSMLVNLERKKQYSEVDNVIEQLKKGMETSSHLVSWIGKMKNKFPISNGKKYVLYCLNILTLIYLLTVYLSDVVTDGLVTQKFHRFSQMANTTSSTSDDDTPSVINKIDKAIEDCRNETEKLKFLACFENKYEIIKNENLPKEDNQFGAKNWRSLFYMSLTHVILPWILFWGLALYLKKIETSSGKNKAVPSKTWKAILTILEILFFPIYTYLEKFCLEHKLTKLRAQEESKQTNEDKENIIKKLERNEEKEILVTNIEVTTESSYQFFMQMMLVLPHLVIGTIKTYKTEKSAQSFGEKMVTLETISIVTSFLAMTRSYYRIRNLSKKNALSGKSAMVNFLLTTLETASRILVVWLFLFLANQNERESIDPEMAILMYYGHVTVMLLFNILFNKDPPTLSVPYAVGLFFNSLSSTYTYSHYDYTKLLQGKPSKNKKNHQPSFLRQILFQTLFLLENIIMTICTLLFFNQKQNAQGKVEVGDGLRGTFDFSKGNLITIITVVWSFQGLAIFLRLIYYQLHPASVSMTKLKEKKQLFVLGRDIFATNSDYLMCTAGHPLKEYTGNKGQWRCSGAKQCVGGCADYGEHEGMTCWSCAEGSHFFKLCGTCMRQRIAMVKMEKEDVEGQSQKSGGQDESVSESLMLALKDEGIDEQIHEVMAIAAIGGNMRVVANEAGDEELEMNK